MASRDLRPAFGVAALAFGVHVLVSARYGFHRDELYYLAGGHRLAPGYVDHPPMVVFVSRAITEIFGVRLWALRVAAGAMHAAIVVIAGLMARELGGRRWAIGVAALAAAAAPVLVGAGSLFQTVILEQMWSALALLLVVRLLNGANPRLWLAVGAVFGAGLQSKWTILAVAAGLAVGFLIVPEARRHLRSPWPWIAVAIAVALWLPNILWQAGNDWPTREFAENNNANVQEEGGRIAFILEQLALLGPLAVPLAGAGLVWLWRRSPWRTFTVAVATMFVVLLAVGGKSYYLAPVFVVVFAAGAVAAQDWALTVRRRRLLVVAGLVVGGLVVLPAVAPVAPQPTYAAVFHDLNPELGEQLGWPNLVDQVAAVYQDLPADERASARILTPSYGEAAAIELYGPSRGIPRGAVLSAHNSYYDWWPDGETIGTVVTVRYQPDRMRDHFGRVEPAGTVSNPWDIENEAYGTPILVCRDPLSSPDQLRDDLRHYN